MKKKKIHLLHIKIYTKYNRKNKYNKIEEKFGIIRNNNEIKELITEINTELKKNESNKVYSFLFITKFNIKCNNKRNTNIKK